MLKDYFRLALNNLRRRKLRSWLTMLGIFIGIAAVVALVGLGQGLQTAVTSQFATLSTDKLTIQNAETGFGPPGSTVVEKLNEHDLKVIERVRGVDIVVPRLIRVVRVEFNNKINFNYMGDVPEEDEKMELVYNAMGLKVREGRLLKQGDNKRVLIGSDVAKKENFGKKIEAGKKIKINGEDFEVVGILKKASTFIVNDVILMLNDDTKELLNIGDEIDMIVAQVEEPKEIKDVADKIEKEMRKDRDLEVGEEDFSVQTPLEAIGAVNSVLSSVNAVVIGIATISLIVGGIGIANTMYTSVLERKKEIGTMKAIGAKNSDILLIFIIESGILGLIGGLVGVAVGMGIAKSIEYFVLVYLGSSMIRASMNPMIIFGCLVFAFVVGLVSGVLPSYQASKLKPVDTLRYE